MERKWQKLAALSRRRITSPRTRGGVDAESCNSATFNQRRFVIPLVYLNHDIFQELLKMAEEEYGLPSHGPITLPCDAVFMEYAFSLIKRGADKDLQKALLQSLTSDCCLSSSHLLLRQTRLQTLICSF